MARRLCREHYQRAWKAGELSQHAKLPPRMIDRKICPPEHQHGQTGTCYVHHQCRCEDCSTSTTRRNYRRLQLKAYGRYDTGLVDVTPVREHLLMLGEFGLGYKRIAQLAGVGITAVRTVLWGRQDPGPRYGELQKRMKRETAEKILAVQPLLENLGATVHVSAKGTVRRLQSLIAFGWSRSRLVAELGLDEVAVYRLLSTWERKHRNNKQGQVKCRAATARTVAAGYERLASTPPAASTRSELAGISRSRGEGLRKGWPLPMDWAAADDDFDRLVPVRRSAN